MGKLREFAFGVCIVIASLSIGRASAEILRIGALATGTVNWELDTIRHHGFDTAQGFTLEVTEYAGNPATQVALQGGEVDAIVSDWLWVAQQRAQGDPARIVYDQHRLGMAGHAAAHLLIGRVGRVAAGIADRRHMHPVHSPEHALRPPEAAQAKLNLAHALREWRPQRHPADMMHTQSGHGGLPTGQALLGAWHG